MKTIIFLALCLLAVSALSPVENLSSALELLDLQHLLDDDCKAFDLSASFTHIGGATGDDNDVAEKVTIQGNYNLLTYEDGKGKLKSGTFNKTKDFTSKDVVNFTGSGSFNARGGGKSEEQGYFNGGSSTDFVVDSDGGWAFGLREHEFSGHFKGKKAWGTGHIQVNAWQHVNSSAEAIEYWFQNNKDGEDLYSGNSKAFAQVTTDDEYKVTWSSVFHGKNSKDSWEISGGWTAEAFDSKWDNVWWKSDSFSKNGSCVDEALGAFSRLRTFGLPSSDLITE